MSNEAREAAIKAMEALFARYVPLGQMPSHAVLFDAAIAAYEAAKPAGEVVATDVFAGLREANISRQAAWCPDQVPDLSFRGNELAGETGEVCNVIKKLERERLGWRGSRDTVEHLAEELADVVICADLAAISAGIDLNAAVVAKFNATSEKVGLPHRLAALAASPVPSEWNAAIEAAAKIADQEVFDEHALAQATEHGRGSHATALEIASTIRALAHREPTNG